MKTTLGNILVMATVVASFLFISCTKDEVDTTGVIYGMVTDADNGQPIQGAGVSLSPGGATTLTGSDGKYEFTNLEVGQYRVQITKAGYQANIKTVSVVAGQQASGDMQLSMATTAIGLSTESLNFGSNSSTQSFDIINKSGSGDVSWTISIPSEAGWLKVTPSSGSTATGKRSAVTVTVNRSQITKNESAILTISAGGGSTSMIVNVEKESSSGGNQGGEPGTSQGVTSCDPNLPVEILSCKRVNSQLTVAYTITNNTGIDLKTLYFNNRSSNSSYSDNIGNFYATSRMAFTAGGIQEKSSVDLLADNSVKCTITIPEFDKDATGFSAQIYCYTSGSTSYKLPSNYIIFRNIPVE